MGQKDARVKKPKGTLTCGKKENMIDPNKHYTLYEIVTQKFIPGVTSVTQMSNIVNGQDD